MSNIPFNSSREERFKSVAIQASAVGWLLKPTKTLPRQAASLWRRDSFSRAVILSVLPLFIIDIVVMLDIGKSVRVPAISETWPLRGWLLQTEAAQWMLMVAVLLMHVVFLVACVWIVAMTQARSSLPLVLFAEAIDALSPDNLGSEVAESGSKEFVVLAQAFNALRRRVKRHLDVRIQILSAFSHDMQTPITRMRLRTELTPDFPEKQKFLKDLAETERLVRDGMAYARNTHLDEEPPREIDLRSLVESIALDYQDTGRPVTISRLDAKQIFAKPRALRRILTNLIDNALKFSGAAEIRVEGDMIAGTTISILDRGPGIAGEFLEAVKSPFFKLEAAGRNGKSGSGLGLAIVQHLANDMAGSLHLRNRSGGGLRAEIRLPHGQGKAG